MKKPALWWGRSGVWVSMELRWVFGGLMILYANVLHLFAMFLRYLNEIVCKITINLTLMY